MKKKPIIILVVCLIAMFAWIFLAVALTGGREISEMNTRDHWVMVGLILAELMTIFLALKLGKMEQPSDGAEQPSDGAEQPNPTRANRMRFAWNLFTYAAALGIPVLLALPGIRLREHSSVELLSLFKGIGDICWALAVAAIAVNVWGLQRFRRRYQQMNAKQMSEFLLSHREQASRTAAEKLRLLCSIRRGTNAYALVLLLLGIVLGVCFGCTGSKVSYAISALLILVSSQQLPIRAAKAELEDLQNILPEQEYPRLYGAAKQAAQETGWTGAVALQVRPDNTAFISLLNQTAVVSLGAPVLRLLTQQELHALLLHEFSHVSPDNKAEIQATNYWDFLRRGRSSATFSLLSGAFYTWSDEAYETNFELYQYAASISTEQAADSAMAKLPEAAASSLLKLKYFDLYLWEAETKDGKPAYESVREDVIREQLADFQKVLPARKADWNDLTKREIEARNATHPTIWSRIQALGLNELPEVAFPAQGEYGAECEKAIVYMDEQLTSFTRLNFEENHRTQYLEPKKDVENWEAAGCPVVAEEYADVVNALHLLGRNSDGIALCNRAIDQLQPIAAAYAYFIRGAWRLRRYDADGLQDLYTAIELNNNSIDSALDVIGTFCTLTGMQQELDTYREKALELAQRQRDEFSETGRLTRKDKLSTEHLPEGMLEDILSHIQAVSQDSIDRIYLVHKTISDTFFTSAFVIRFLPQTSQEVRQEVLHQIFCYLDTCADWQFSLFEYQEIPKGLVERVPDSCVYQRT